jgi:MFS family permease
VTKSEAVSVDRHLPSSVLILGIVSLLTATSTAMIIGLLPVFLATVLGAQMIVIGVIEGLAGAAMSIAKIFAGAVSDWLGRRKPLLLFGYGMSALVKLLFPVAESVPVVLVARAADRIGKGVRDAPRDALVADITPQPVRGSGFGLRAALYTAGFVIGPLTAMALMARSGNDFRLVFWAAVIPALIGIVLLAVGVREGARASATTTIARRPLFDRKRLVQLTAGFWWIVAIASVFSLARFSQAFLVLKAHDAGVAAALIPTVIMVMHVVFSVAAYPCGILADRVSRRAQLALAGVTLAAADLILAFATDLWMTALGAASWGLQMGLSYGLLKAAVADEAPEDLRGTAFGVYDFMIGLTSFLASFGAGLVWAAGGSGLAFLAGAALAAAAAGIVTIWPAAKRAGAP